MSCDGRTDRAELFSFRVLMSAAPVCWVELRECRASFSRFSPRQSRAKAVWEPDQLCFFT